jgi:hypothetical protein
LGFYEKAVPTYKEIDAKSGKSNYYAAELVRALNNVGLARAVAGKLGEGQRNIERSTEIRERIVSASPQHRAPRRPRPRLLSLGQDPRPERSADKAKESIRKAEELYAGIPPLDSLRSRPDFQELFR